MFDKRLLVTGVSLLMVMAVAVAAAVLPGRNHAAPGPEGPVHDVATTRATAPAAPPQQREYLYLIKEYNGRVAVFGEDSDIPEMILDTFVRHLPAYDRIQLREGVRVYSLHELEARIEDYTS